MGISNQGKHMMKFPIEHGIFTMGKKTNGECGLNLVISNSSILIDWMNHLNPSEPSMTLFYNMYNFIIII